MPPRKHVQYLLLPVVISRLPWPFAACAMHCESSEELTDLARRATAGDLGDITDWLAAEERWNAHGITVHDIRFMSNEHWPFDREIASHGFPFAVGSRTVTVPSATEGTLGALNAILDELPRSRMRSTILDSLFQMLNSFYTGKSLLPTRFRHLQSPKLIEEARSAAAMRYGVANLLRDFSESEPRTSTLLNQYTANPFFDCSQLPKLAPDVIGKLVSEFIQDSKKHGILRLLAGLLTKGEGEAVKWVDQLPVNLNELSEPHLQQAGIVVRIAQSSFRVHEAARLAELTVEVNAKKSDTIAMVIQTLAGNHIQSPATDRFLLELLDRAPTEAVDERTRILSRLNDSMRRRNSNLADATCWEKLKFPKELTAILGNR